MANNGSSELPREVLAVLPSDPYEQLDVARKITAMAISSRLSMLETESGKLKQRLQEKDQIAYSLQERVSELEQALQESSVRLSQALDEQTKLASEKNTLATSVKKLTRDVTKLETFKRALMQSLQEDDDASTPSASAEKPTASQLMSFDSSLSTSSSLSESDILAARGQNTEYKPAGIGVGSSRSVSLKYSSMQGDEAQVESASKSMPSHTYSLTPPRLTPQLTPTGSPKQSGASSPIQYSASGSPKQHSLSDSQTSFSSSQPTSKRTTAPNSPPKGSFSASRTPRVDGKEFFRQARNRLSYEQFSAFLANIKELNAHRQSREETLRKADEIFGAENKDLYQSFDGLLSRHLPAQG
ncbi:hypothetical protein GOP47_0011670 [Adiantum capillus-veneris]|uniref:At4g15545-like C-terminal domain-containing protein n=1 Tax=Adiantum capillus-veneris TaxID=13818 RepID=A0A9D4ZGZ3_ADICA|nr:hypothetical protein GOP47_0011670 [Adiantum capillus-veneris]